MKWSIFFSNIFIHVAVMSLFLTVFFFTIASAQEKAIVENQINFIMDEFVGNTLGPLSESEKEPIKKNLDDKLNNAKEDLKSADKDVENQNNKTIKKAFTFVGIVVAIVAFITIIMGFYFKWNHTYRKFLVSSAIAGLIFVGITETLFLFLIAKGYYSVDPNRIKKHIIDKLLDNEVDKSCKSS